MAVKRIFISEFSDVVTPVMKHRNRHVVNYKLFTTQNEKTLIFISTKVKTLLLHFSGIKNPLPENLEAFIGCYFGKLKKIENLFPAQLHPLLFELIGLLLTVLPLLRVGPHIGLYNTTHYIAIYITIHCSTMQCNIIHYNTLHCFTIQYLVIHCNAVQCNTM